MVATMASVMMLTGCGNSLVDDAKETCLPQNLGYEDLTYEKVFDSYPYARKALIGKRLMTSSMANLLLHPSL